MLQQFRLFRSFESVLSLMSTIHEVFAGARDVEMFLGLDGSSTLSLQFGWWFSHVLHTYIHTIPYLTLHYLTLPYITSHHITLHYITYTHIYIYIYMIIYIYINIYINNMYVCVCTCVCVYVCMCVCVFWMIGDDRGWLGRNHNSTSRKSWCYFPKPRMIRNM